MDVPATVRQELDDEQVVARVPFPDDSGLYLTPNRLLVHSASGLLSDESVAVHPLDAERLSVDAGRRTATVTLGYVDGEAEFTAPADRVDDVVGTVLPAVLRGSGAADRGEAAVETYRFGELTLVVTHARLLKHVGNAVWGPDNEVVAYDDVVELDVEEGSVSSQLVVRTPDRDYRIKLPSEHVRAVHQTVEGALLGFHGFESYAEFERHAGEETSEDDGGADSIAAGVEPLRGDADAGTDHDADEERAADGSDDPGIQVVDVEPDDANVDREKLERRVERLERTLERQQKLLEEQQELVTELLDALD